MKQPRFHKYDNDHELKSASLLYIDQITEIPLMTIRKVERNEKESVTLFCKDREKFHSHLIPLKVDRLFQHPGPVYVPFVF